VNRQSKTWKFQLYVAGDSSRSRTARVNLERICRASLGNNYTIEILDLLEHPKLWRQHQVLATPTVIRRSPTPERRVIGDLSVTEQVLKSLDIPKLEGQPAGPASPEAGSSVEIENPELNRG
jgi:circadian clock protein KaiB